MTELTDRSGILTDRLKPDRLVSTVVRVTTRHQILAVALGLFARDGYLGTSLQQIADVAGTSKATILYHFTSKEGLLHAAVQPCIEEFTELMPQIAQTATSGSTDDRRVLIGRFVTMLARHREAVTIFVTQRGALMDIPAIEAGNAMIQQISAAFTESDADDYERVRLGIALAGVTFIVSDSTVLPSDDDVDSDHIAVLTNVLLDLVTPLGDR